MPLSPAGHRHSAPPRTAQGEDGRPGTPVSVLLGHDGAVAFVDFHPTIPDALLSAGFDGTLRIWRARDDSAPPIVLRVDPARFGLSGHAVTRRALCVLWAASCVSGLVRLSSPVACDLAEVLVRQADTQG